MYCEAVSFFIFESYSLFHIQQKEKYADISVFLFRKNSLFHKITRTPFHLLIDLTHIFANYSTCQQNGSANKPQGNQQRSPSRNCRTFYKRADSIYNSQKGYQYKHKAKISNVAQRTYRKRSNPISAKLSILLKGYFDSPAKRGLRL